MDCLNDDQLTTVFDLCDQEGKGFITAKDLRIGLASTLNPDLETLDQILRLLRLGPNDSLDLEQFLSRVRQVDDDPQDQDGESPGCSSPEQHNSPTKATSTSHSSSEETVVVVDESSPNRETEHPSFQLSQSPTMMPRFMTSSRAALSLSRNRSGSDIIYSSQELLPNDQSESICTSMSQSLNDLVEKVSELKFSQSESQDEFRSLFSKLSINLQTETDRRMDHLLSSIEEKLSTKTRNTTDDNHLRCKLEKAEIEKRNLHLEVCCLRDRVLELSHSVTLRDEELVRERRANEELKNRLHQVENDLLKSNQLRIEQRSVQRALMFKLETLTKDKDETRNLREALNMERMRIEKERASLALEAARLASESEHYFNNLSQGGYKSYQRRLNLSIEDDEIQTDDYEDKAEVLSQVLGGAFTSGPQSSSQFKKTTDFLVTAEHQRNNIETEPHQGIVR